VALDSTVEAQGSTDVASSTAQNESNLANNGEAEEKLSKQEIHSAGPRDESKPLHANNAEAVSSYY